MHLIRPKHGFNPWGILPNSQWELKLYSTTKEKIIEESRALERERRNEKLVPMWFIFMTEAFLSVWLHVTYRCMLNVNVQYGDEED